ncbi:MAG: Uma2 family endonuclease [Abditibacteriales bacterium]|nr:Uma2 family endonuclease [Abditibacteriales bacterium]MDW8366697.1 Uma2 family endonuclease [Abditibacteriales bacterium]
MAVQTPTKTKRIPMSKEEFRLLPEGPPFYDYVNGEAVEVNRPTGKHSQIMFRLASKLWEHVHAKDLGDVYSDIDVELPTGHTFGPDIVFLSKEHLDRYDEASGDLYGVPDLIVEILSPSNADYDRYEKFAYYHEAGVPWVWFVEQDTLTIEEFCWQAGGYLWLGAVRGGKVFKPKLFPDLEINLKDLLGAT